MSFDERVDVVDLILKVLKDHEKSLDTLVSQMGETLTQSQAAAAGQVQGHNRYKVVLHRWSEFRERCIKSELIAFDIVRDKFHVTVVKNGGFYAYLETIPEVTIKLEKEGDKVLIEGDELMGHKDVSYIFNGKLQCGLAVSTRKGKVTLPNGDVVHKIMYEVDPDEATKWLADELKTDKKSIIFGSITP